MADPKASAAVVTQSANRVTVWAVAAVFSVSSGFLALQWQGASDQAKQNERDIAELTERISEDLARADQDLETEIDRLDESNRNRRIELAELEERIAVLETVTGVRP